MRYRVTALWQRVLMTRVWSLFFFLELGACFDCGAGAFLGSVDRGAVGSAVER
jgi:hypothetical protein